LERKALKPKLLERLQVYPDLGNDNLQLVAVEKPQRRASLWAHTYPIDPSRRGCDRPIRLYRNLKAAFMERADQGIVQL
jgi:hypothetical protein